MSTESTPKIVLVGMGQMGHYYANILVGGCGIDPDAITMVDLKPETFTFSEQELAKNPNLAKITRKTTSLSVALEDRPDIAFNLTNSPVHLSVFERLVGAGVPNVFFEKPIVPTEHLERLISLPKFNTISTVGYVINFSEAVQRLMGYCDEHDLRVRLCTVEWGKPRFGNSRPTAGVHNDEMCHGQKLFELLVRNTSRVIGPTSVQATVLRLPYVDLAVQEAAEKLDPSFSLSPSSNVQLHAIMEADGNDAHLLLRSSFVRPTQSREVTFLFSTGDESQKPTHIARLQFDVDGHGDILEFGKIGEKLVPEVFKGNKLLAMMQAFLQQAVRFGRDSRLIRLDEAVQDVRFADATEESGRRNGAWVQVAE